MLMSGLRRRGMRPWNVRRSRIFSGVTEGFTTSGAKSSWISNSLLVILSY